MKKILIIALSLVSFISYSQTQINPSGSNSVANINTAVKGSITATGTDAYAATMTGFTWGSGEAMDITFVNGNTAGPYTFSLNGGSALTFKKLSSGSLVNLVAGDISPGQRLRFYHNGTYLVMQSGGGGGTVTSVSGTANQIASTGGTAPVLSIVTNPILPGAPTIASPGNSTQNIITTDATQTLSNKTLVAPALGTPVSGVATNLTGTAAGLTAGNVTTNANLTGDVTSTGNATAIASGVIVDADVNASAAIAGTKLSNTPAGNISSTTVQAAINELDTEKASTSSIPSISSFAEVLAATDNTKVVTPLRLSNVTGRVYNVLAYGAAGDGKTITDGAISSGTAILTSASGLFLSTDVGKYIRVGGAGASSTDLHTTILSYQSATQVTIATNASTTVSSMHVQWGTDNTTAIQSAINAAFANYGGVIYFPNGYYLVAGALQTNVGGINPNAQIYIPKMEPNTTTGIAIKFLGESVPNKLRSLSTVSSVVNNDGVIIQSTILGSGTKPRVFGTVQSVFYNAFNYAETEFENIQIRVRSKTAGVCIAPTMAAFGMGKSDNNSAINCVADIECYIYESALPTNAAAVGFETPNINNTQTAGGIYDRCIAQGFYKGWEVSEHSKLRGSVAIGNYYGFALQGGGQPIYLNAVNSLHNKYDMVFEGDCIVTADGFQIENSLDATRWYYNTYSFYAPSPVTSYGLIKYLSSQAESNVGINGTFGNVSFTNLRFSQRQVVIGGKAYPTVSAGAGIWNGTITPGSGNNRAIFEIGSTISESTDASWPDFVMSHNQLGTSNVVARYVVLNNGSGASDKRIINWLHSTNGNVTKGMTRFFYGNGSTAVEVATMSSDDTRFATKTYIGTNVTTAPTAKLHLGAGSATAGTAPVKYTSGALTTVVMAGQQEFDDAFYLSNTAINRIAVGGKISGAFTSSSNTGTGETDLFTYTTKASTLAKNDEEIEFTGVGTFNDATATPELKFYFAGTSVGATTALTLSTTGAFEWTMRVKRTGSTTASGFVIVRTSASTTTLYLNQVDLTGITFTNTNIIKITGTATGAGGGTGDITAKEGRVMWWPAANN